MKNFVSFAVLRTTLAVLFAASGALAETPLNLKSVEPREAKAFQYDKATQNAVNSEFTFEVTGKPEITEREILLNGTLTNASNQTKIAYLSTKTPFCLELSPNDRVQSKPVESKTPSLFVVDVPPKSQIPFTASLPLSQLTYTGEPDAKMKWTFRFWSDPRPTGTLQTRLPSRTSDALKLTIERYDNSATKSAKLVATLTNVSPAPQLFCKNTVKWTDPSGDEASAKPEAKLTPECKVLAPQETTEVETATFAGGELHTPLATLKNVKKLKVQVENGATLDLAAKYRAPSPMKTIEATTSL